MKRDRISIPKEHGAWAIFLVSLLIGSIVGGKWNSSLLLFVIGALCAFAARAPLSGLWQSSPRREDTRGGRRLLQMWLVIYGGFSFLAFLPLLIYYRRPLLLLFGAAGLVLLFLHRGAVVRHRERALPTEILAAVGLSLAAPGAYYVSSGTLDFRTFTLWAVNAAFFSAQVCYVQMRVQAQRFHRFFLQGTAAAVYAGILSAVILLCVASFFPAVFLLPFVPSLLQVLGASVGGGRRLLIRRLGWLGVLHSAAFGALFLVSWSLAYRGL